MITDMQVPMITDFAVRLVLGLSGLLLATSPRAVPPPFFRTHCLVILGLLVLSALMTAGVLGSTGAPVFFLAGLAFTAYLASALWGIGLPRLAYPLTLLIAVGSAAWLIDQSRAPSAALWTLAVLTRFASGFLMGAAVSAMLLGHHYLTAPTMTIEPLKRYARCMAWGMAVRVGVALIGLGFTFSTAAGSALPRPEVLFGPPPGVLLAARWGVGLAAAGVAVWMAWSTTKIESTQSATGIMYIATILIFFGELTAMVLASDGLLT